MDSSFFGPCVPQRCTSSVCFHSLLITTLLKSFRSFTKKFINLFVLEYTTLALSCLFSLGCFHFRLFFVVMKNLLCFGEIDGWLPGDVIVAFAFYLILEAVFNAQYLHLRSNVFCQISILNRAIFISGCSNGLRRWILLR